MGEQKFSSRCDLCRNTRVSPGSELGLGYPGIECPWCKSVRLQYGSYSYPVSDSVRDTPSPIDEISRQVGVAMAIKLDDAIRAALNVHLGRSDWQLEELRGRLHEIHCRGDKHSTFYCDGVELLTARELEVSMHGGCLAATRQILRTIAQTR